MSIDEAKPTSSGFSREQLRSHVRSQFRARMVSLFLVGPAVVFIFLAFIVPLASMMFYAVNNPEVRSALPRTVEQIAHWDGKSVPDDAVFNALATDLRAHDGGNAIAEAGRRLNYEIPGFRTVLLRTSRALQRDRSLSGREAFFAIDANWNDLAHWNAIKRASSAFTSYYLLAAIDLRVTDDAKIARAAPEQRLFVSTLGRTIEIGIAVTLICLLLGFPLAHAVTVLPARFASVVLACILLPFWTSLLVRTSAWIVILQKEGLINKTLAFLGIVSAPLELVFNRTGLYIAMVHILLPFMVLPVLSVMTGISPSYMRASASLGAGPIRSFFLVYLPLTLPGVGAGCLLTFIIAAGYYITPTLVGGANDQMLSYFVAFFANTTINWGMSAALGLVLLVCVVSLYVVMGRLIGINRIAGIG